MVCAGGGFAPQDAKFGVEQAETVAWLDIAEGEAHHRLTVGRLETEQQTAVTTWRMTQRLAGSHNSRAAQIVSKRPGYR